MRNIDEIVKEIKNSDTWDLDLLKEFCSAADLLDEWEESNGETFERVVFKAAERLGVTII